MSYADGWAAIHLEMTDRVPRTEYSADSHWNLIKVVTGMDVTPFSSQEIKEKASTEFKKAWNYDFIWHILIHNQIFGDKRTAMGHAEYAAGGSDFDRTIFSLYDDPEKALAFDPWQLYGVRDKKSLIQDFNADYRKKCIQYPDAVNMTGIYVSCMSGLIEIFGWEILLSAAGIDSDGFGEVTNRYALWIKQYFEALAECEAPVVMIHDDIVWTSGAFLHPDWYRRYIFPNYKKCFAPLVESGKKIMYTSDGIFNSNNGRISN